MKMIATFLTVLLSCAAFAQSENLVNYRIETSSVVTGVTVIAMSSREEGNTAVGRVASIQHATINLELNPNRDYTVIINGDSFVEIKRNDIAAFQAKELAHGNVAEVVNAVEGK